ncbi:MAG: hypothetical protein ACM3PY_00440 [Omnitrophica WOR_2 bacterium]
MKKTSWFFILLLVGAMLAGCASVNNILPIKTQPAPTPAPPIAPAQQYASASIQAAGLQPVKLTITYFAASPHPSEPIQANNTLTVDFYLQRSLFHPGTFWR